ncbi:unnamed protein product [Rotaria sp. Silwood2]|nr:unnamed protein product [Rotaria sp. Silwood2]CAF3081272.1 unnamed protein product [Rotaria sp. Silwood2]CAF4329783.1 unnamed protein product [Rotaria sp. Silwood2]CAF4364851.1 unnamed protein product [Rotaria sp. Silwood2]CAF4520336.1 unnamed protein product [Rotaria sp. Silwood2]
MAEQKVPIDEVVRQISNTLTKHGEVIQRIQETLGSIQPQLDSQITTVREETQQQLQWYCQLYITNTVPTNWDQFITRFLAQFHSPIRAAQQEQEWSDCKQQKNETINEFVVRLRSLWLEQKSDEKESEFIKHLFCKMRPDILTLMNASRSASLDEIIVEAQQVEEILYLRNKELRLRNTPRSKPMFTRTNTTPLMSLSTPTHHSPRNAYPVSTAQSNPTCWRCYETGHYASNCPLNDAKRTFESNDFGSQPLPPRSKNT